MTGATLIWVLLLGGLVTLAVLGILWIGLKHGEHAPEKPEDSQAVEALRRMNAERLARIEAARSKSALPSGEAKSS